MKKKDKGMGLQVSFAVIGFFLLGGLSLSAGNSVLTSLIRGTFGLLAMFGLGFVFKFALHLFVGETKSEDPRGKIVDLILPGGELTSNQSNKPQTASDPAMAADFVPLAQSVHPKDVNEEEAKKMAEALRHLED